MTDEREVYSDVTRLEVIDWRRDASKGRAFIAWNVRVAPSIQDEGRTLKIFVTDPPSFPPSGAPEA